GVCNVAREDAEDDEVVELERAAEAGEKHNAPAGNAETTRFAVHARDGISRPVPTTPGCAGWMPHPEPTFLFGPCRRRERRRRGDRRCFVLARRAREPIRPLHGLCPGRQDAAESIRFHYARSHARHLPATCAQPRTREFAPLCGVVTRR